MCIKKENNLYHQPSIYLMGIFLFFIAATSQASLQDQIGTKLGGLMNTTPTGTFKTATSTFFSGGDISIHNKRVSGVQIYHFSAPHVAAGCGGIDLYGGSFSFIDGPKLTTLLRSIASNAQTYAFKLAFTALCPTCNSMMNDLETTMNKLNDGMRNSCEMAHQFVDAVAPGLKSAADESRKTGKSLLTRLGVSSDANDAAHPKDGHSSSHDAAHKLPPVEFSKMIGNLAWEVMGAQHFKNWFLLGGDDQLKQTIMSMTGTIIVNKPTGAEEQVNVNSYPGAMIPLDVLINGFKTGTVVQYYKCDNLVADPKCLTVTPTLINNSFKSIKQIINEILYGKPGVSPGIIAKLTTNITTPYTSQEKGFIEHMPAGMGSLLRKLAETKDPTKLKIFTDINVEIIAVIYAQSLLDEFMQDFKSAEANYHGKLPVRSMNKILANAEADYKKEINVVKKKAPDKRYRELIASYQMLNKIRYRNTYEDDLFPKLPTLPSTTINGN